MDDFWKLFVLVGVVASLVGMVAFFSIGLSGVLMPWQEEIRRETYEESRTHVEATIDDISRYRLKLQDAPQGQQEMISNMILRRARDIERDELPPRLRTFVDSLEDAR